ncbi:hypothetical protein [Aquimarina algiphila]|uniref:Uncharacterized protein n=1 Tax=Aquimarina algiphila TaxID=2047982 RepID=A0A554VCF9_9FLAO|nr:hypothetical protein [Aquimarina algiphila]TSE04376.1 hypothetical protein FOF46_26485 [Aquimarina algiphila]
MNATKREIVEKWLLDNEDIINKAGLDDRLDFPNGTLQKFFKYGRKLNQKRIIKIHRFLLKLSITGKKDNNQLPK